MSTPRGRRRRIFLVLLILFVFAAIFGVRRILRGRWYQSTDDAFIEAHVVDISPRVASNVVRLFIDDNKHVKMGDLLLELDPRDFEARLRQARADLAEAQAAHRAAEINVRLTTTTSGASVRQAEAAVRQSQRQLEEARHAREEAHAQAVAAEAEVVRAGADVQRYQRLLQYGAVSRQEADNALAASRTAVAQLQAARQAEQAAAATIPQRAAAVQQSQAELTAARAAPDQIRRSRAQAEQANAQIAQMQAAVRQAELDLSYTTLRAPKTGRVTRKSVERGDFVQAGQKMFSIVPDSVFVVANFKETQLRRIRPGQLTEIKVDAYPDTVFRGRVQSIQAGSGAAFSLLPPENATGNFVKVVQRVPVKIVFIDRPDPRRVLGPGMSVVPTVKVR